jgi:hypothetical protein
MIYIRSLRNNRLTILSIGRAKIDQAADFNTVERGAT